LFNGHAFISFEQLIPSRFATDESRLLGQMGRDKRKKTTTTQK
jgi:hypothetical protein